MTLKAAILIAALALPSAAFSWTEPARGTDLRADLMDAVRPLAEWDLGAPVAFVVWDLRAEGNAAFASLMARRPGGAGIIMEQTPAAMRGEIDASVGDGATIQVLLRREGRMWVAVHYGIGATDVWYDHPDFCPLWSEVIPEICDDK